MSEMPSADALDTAAERPVIDLTSSDEDSPGPAASALQPGKEEQKRDSTATTPQVAGTASATPGGSVVHDGGLDGVLDSDSEDNESAWSGESMFEDNLKELTDQDNKNDSSISCCSLEEAQFLRNMLDKKGPEHFIQQTYEAGLYSARKLCTAFGASIGDALDVLPDERFLEALGALMSRFLSKRRKLAQHNTPDDAAELLRTSKNVIVITGAGISTNLGIPDFRSKGTGLYSRLHHLGLEDPQEAFSMDLFAEAPEIFYSVAKDIYPSTKHFSPTHAFIRLLQDKGKLLTNFTQNIDNLEEAAGVQDDKLIQCHGSWRRATCQKCGHNVPGSEIEEALKAGEVAKCKECVKQLEQQGTGMKRKRSHSAKPNKKRRSEFDDSSDDEGQFDIEEPGIMKPDITFFGEDLPRIFHRRLLDHDKDLVDLCIVIGTSLKVSPVADIPDFLPGHVPQIYISRDPVKHIQFDIELLGDCDEIVTELCRRAGLDLQHEMIKEGTAVKESPDESGHKWRWTMAAEAGGIIDAKEIDDGTLGHGTALSPKASRTRDLEVAEERLGA